MSLSPQSWRRPSFPRRPKGGDRRDGAGRMGEERVWRAWGLQHLALPWTFPCHHADSDQSADLSDEKGSLSRSLNVVVIFCREPDLVDDDGRFSKEQT